MKYGLAVVGAGPAGYAAAFEAASKGMQVILFEKGLLGGTCLNRGCVPTKYLAHAAELYGQAKELHRYGIRVSDITIDPLAMHAKKDAAISYLRDGLRQKLDRQRIAVVHADARVLGPHTVLAGGTQYEADNILIAAGSVPAKPLISGAVTSDGMFRRTDVPKTLKIIGGGAIAAEMAHIYSSLGTAVTVCLRGSRMLRQFDRELSSGLMSSLKEKGVVILTGCSLQQMQEIPAALVLSAAGRVPAFEKAQAEMLGIAYDGGIIVDGQGRTSVPGIYAAGDVIKGSPQLAHTAMEQGIRAVQAMAGELRAAPGAVVHCIYVSPEIASVGYCAADAKQKGIPVVTGKQVMSANARTVIGADGRGFIKITARRDTGAVVGAQMMCGRACEIAAEFALAIDQGLTVWDLLDLVHPHPSYCEEIRQAAAVVKGKIQCGTNI